MSKKKWREPSTCVVTGSFFVPACQCCGTEENLTWCDAAIKPLKIVLCPICINGYYKVKPRRGAYPFQNAVVCWFICPEHGSQIPCDVNESTLPPVFGYPVKGNTGDKIWGMSKYRDERIE